MKKIRLSSRLAKAFALVPSDANVIDVGADRGQFSLALALNGHIVFAVENKKGPYEALCQTFKEYSDLPLTASLSDGLDILPKEVDTACLLGMGGETITSILTRGEKKLSQLQTIIIEPQSAFSQPISFLIDHGYQNDAGEYIFERRYYPLLRFVKQEKAEETSGIERKYGPYPVSQKDKLLLSYLRKEISQLEPYKENTNTAQKISELEEETSIILNG